MASIMSYFPNGVRIIVIDSDEASLHEVAGKLQCYKHYSADSAFQKGVIFVDRSNITLLSETYQSFFIGQDLKEETLGSSVNDVVTPCTKASSALDILNHARGRFDLLLTEFRIADMDALSLLHHVKANFDVPIIVMSSERRLEIALECLNAGASLCVEKPVEYAVLANFWQYVVAKRRESMSARVREIEQVLGPSSTSCSVTGDISQKETGKVPVMEDEEEEEDDDVEEDENKDGDEDCDDPDDDEEIEKDGNSTKKKLSRVVWTGVLHQKFIEAVNKIGVNKAVPRKILELMKVPTLTRAHVASHLQKYRQYLKRKAEGEQALDNSTSSRLLVNKRRSVFDSVPNQSTLNNKQEVDMLPKGKSCRPTEQMDILLKGKASCAMDQMQILPTGKSTCPMERSTVQELRSLSQPNANMGISIAPRQRQLQKQKTLLPRSPGNTKLLDNPPKNNFFGVRYLGSSISAAGALPPLGMPYSIGFSTMLPAGNPGALNVPSQPLNYSFLTGRFPINMGGMSQPPPAMSSSYNYVGLQLQTATGKLEFAKDGSIIATEMLSVDGTSGGKENADRVSHDQSVKRNQTAAEKTKCILIDSDNASLGQIDPSTTTIDGNNILTEMTTPVQDVQDKNDLSVNDFSEIGFDSLADTLEDFSFENFTSLLFDQQEDMDGAYDEENRDLTISL